MNLPHTVALASFFSLAAPVVHAEDGSAGLLQTGTESHWVVDAFTLEVVGGDDGLLRAVQAAAATWGDTGLGPQIVVVPADKAVGGGFKSDGHNTLMAVHDGWAGNARAAALTARSIETNTHAMVEVDVLVNFADYPFVDGSEHGALDLQSVLTHELGHTLGLLDDGDHAEATMFYGSSDFDISKRTLSDLDTANLARVYQNVLLPPAAVGCASSGLDASLLGALALLPLVVRVRRATASKTR